MGVRSGLYRSLYHLAARTQLFACSSLAVDVETNGATSKGTESGWMGRHLSGSIYMWACGEKAEDEVHGPVLSDRLIAWGILFVSKSR